MLPQAIILQADLEWEKMYVASTSTVCCRCCPRRSLQATLGYHTPTVTFVASRLLDCNRQPGVATRQFTSWLTRGGGLGGGILLSGQLTKQVLTPRMECNKKHCDRAQNEHSQSSKINSDKDTSLTIKPYYLLRCTCAMTHSLTRPPPFLLE